MLRRKRIAEDKDLASLEDKRLKTEASVLEESNTIKQTNLDVKNDTKENRDEVEPISTVPESVPDKILLIEQELCNKLRNIVFQSSVEYIYNPLEYASEPHAMYVRKYCTGAKKILFVGMNPGPWGMSQTGVPFGEIKMVRDWLKISGSVGNPAKEHPDRKVTGFQCTRSEISGQRLWGLFKELCGDSENFFQYTYVHNYCPYALMNANARNITPAELKSPTQKDLHLACDKALIDIVKLLKVEIIVGIGRYAEKRAQMAVQTAGLSAKVVFLPHPSPRAVGNENWGKKATQKLSELELLKFYKNTNTTV